MEMEIPGNGLGNSNGAEEMLGFHENIGGGTGYNREKPPEDDCCPICLGEFKVPCKANCSHWFCGSCVLQLWKYRSRPRRCKCPFCSCPITKLTPEASTVNKTEFEVAEVLENRFYVEGIRGFFLMFVFYLCKHGPFLHLCICRMLKELVWLVIASPVFLKRALVDLTRHPERIRINFQRLRFVPCTLSLLLHLSNCFLPSGNLRIKVAKMITYIDCASLFLVVLPFMLIIFKTWIHIMWLRFRIWQVKREVDVLREQEAALREHAEILRGQEVALEKNSVLIEQNNTS